MILDQFDNEVTLVSMVHFTHEVTVKNADGTTHKVPFSSIKYTDMSRKEFIKAVQNIRVPRT